VKPLSIENAYQQITRSHDPQQLFAVFLLQNRANLDQVAVWSIYDIKGKPHYLRNRRRAFKEVLDAFPELFVGLYCRKLRDYDLDQFKLDVWFAHADRMATNCPYGWIIHNQLQTSYRTPELMYRRRHCRWIFDVIDNQRREYKKDSSARAWRMYWGGNRSRADYYQAKALGNLSRDPNKHNPFAKDESGFVKDFTILRVTEDGREKPIALSFS